MIAAFLFLSQNVGRASNPERKCTIRSLSFFSWQSYSLETFFWDTLFFYREGESPYIHFAYLDEPMI